MVRALLAEFHDAVALKAAEGDLERTRYTNQDELAIRATRGDLIVLGPGKADLLAAIGDTGSIRSAAEWTGMSYMRAWSLVRTMNAAR